MEGQTEKLRHQGGKALAKGHSASRICWRPRAPGVSALFPSSMPALLRGQVAGPPQLWAWLHYLQRGP